MKYTSKLSVKKAGKSKAVNTHNHTYYTIKPKIPQQQMITKQPTKLPTNT